MAVCWAESGGLDPGLAAYLSDREDIRMSDRRDRSDDRREHRDDRRDHHRSHRDGVSRRWERSRSLNRVERHRESRHRSRSRSRGDVDVKLRRLEERRMQEAEDAQYEWGGAASTANPPTTSSTNPTIPAPLSRVAKLESLKSTPFIRYASDPALNASLKQSVRWDDPARTFVDSLKPIVQQHRIQPNRFGIPPGREWDGVDRSNGFEAKFFKQEARGRVRRDEGELRAVRDY